MKLAVFLTFVVAASAVPHSLINPQSAIPANDDEITNLPGLNTPIKFRQFAGYLDLPNSSKHMFYWFVEAVENPASAPVVLWTNGGPGCSGLIGFLSENGPFRPLKNLTLELNPYAWNRKANFLFIEQPAGVGFSYSDDTDDYNTGDAQAATDNYHLILEFLKRYPSLAKNDFYLASESYGGHYIPTLAKEIVTNDKAHAINFKGFLVGNPLTNMVENAIGMYDTLYGHSVVSRPTHDEWVAKCRSGSSSGTCQDLEQTLLAEAGNLDLYAIDYPVCDDQVRKHGRAQRQWLLNHIHANKSPELKKALRLIPPSDFQPCEDEYLTDFLNQNSVKKAIHANVSITWGECSNVVNYNQTDVNTPVQDIYTFLIKGGYNLRMLVFSGDDDTVCGSLGTQDWIWNLKLAKKQAWAPWNYNDSEYGNQIAGYLVKFEGLSFATVHGAGHEVPTFRPEPGLALFEHFLAGDLN